MCATMACGQCASRAEPAQRLSGSTPGVAGTSDRSIVKLLQWQDNVYQYLEGGDVRKVYECLLTALCVEQPADPMALLATKARQLEEV